MPAEHTSKEHPGEVVDLFAAVSSLVMSVVSARVTLDRETVQLAKLYHDHEILRQFPVPAFGISEVTLRLPYAAVDVNAGRGGSLKTGALVDVPHMLVHVNADVLAPLPEHAISYVEVKLSQQTLDLLLGASKPE